MKRIIKFTAASKMMRELLKSGYKVERGAANVSSELSGNVMKIRRGAPLSEFWHESGHALDMHGTADGLKRATAYAEAQAAQKATGAAPNLAYRQQTRDLERRANRTAEQAMTDRGARPEYVQQYRNEVAPHLNDYRKSNSVAAPSGNPANPPGNPGNPGSPIGINTSASPAQQAQPAIPREPIKRSFGGAGLAIGGAGLLAAGGFAAASQKRPKDEEQGFSSKAKLIQFMKNPLHREGIKPGTHRLGGVGVERKVRIRDIVSSQALVDEKKVRKLARFTKNMPGKATVSWNGKNWIAKDGNHRLNAMLKQGKRKATVLVQKLSSPSPLIQFARVIIGAHAGTATDSGDYRVIPKRVNPLQKLTGEGKSKWTREIVAADEVGALSHFPDSESGAGKWRVKTEMPTTSYDYRGRNNRHIIAETITHEQLVKRAGQRNYPTVEQVATMRPEKGGGEWMSDHGKAEHFPPAAAKPSAAPTSPKGWSRNAKIGAGLGAAAMIGAGAYAALRKPKEQQLSSPSPLIQFMHNTDQPQPIGIRKRKLIKPRNSIQQLSALLDNLIELAPGISKKYAAGTQWDQDVETIDERGKLRAKPSLAKEYHSAVIKQAEPKIRGAKINRRVEPFIGEIGHKSFNPASVKEYEDDVLYKQKNVPYPGKPGKTYTRREIDDAEAPGGRRGVKASDLRNTEGYRALKARQISQQDAPRIRQGYSEADLIARDVKESDRPALRRGIDADPSPAGKREVIKAHAGMRRKLVAGDVKPEIKNIRSAIAEDTDINRRLVHAIRKERGESGEGGFFREPEKGIIPMNPKSAEYAMKGQRDLLAAARGNFDTIMEGETARRKAQAGALHENVRKRANEALVAREHGPDWKTKLTGRKREQAIQAHAKKASDFASSITAQLPVRQDELADLLKAKPEGMERARQQYHSLLNPDARTHRKVQNRIIRSGKVFDGTPAFEPPAPKVIAKKGYPTLKKIGIAGAVLGGGALAYHMLKKRREQEPQPQLMSSRARLIQFAKIPKKFPVKLPANADSALTNLAHKLLNKAEGTAVKNEAKFAGGKMPGPEAPASQWAQVEAAQDISPEATELVDAARKRVRKAIAKPGGLKKLQPHDVVGDKMAEELSPMSKGIIKNEKKKLWSGATPALPLRGSRAALAQGRIESTLVERGIGPFTDINEVAKALNKTPEQAQRIIAVQRPIVARKIREDRAAKRGYTLKHGQDPDVAITRIKSEMLKAQGDKRAAEKAAAQGIAVAREQAKAEVGAIRKSSESATQEALGKQSATHAEQTKKARSAAWRNTAIGTGAGFLGGIAIAGNASRHSYEPKRKLLMASRSPVVRFSSDAPIKPRKIRKSTLSHDVAVGAIEGGIVGPFTQPVFSRLGGEKPVSIVPGGIRSKKGWKKFGKNALIGAGFGALTTSATGLGVNVMSPFKFSSKRKLIEFSKSSERAQVSRDRYEQQNYDKDELRAGANYKRSALAGGTLAMLLRGSKTRLGTFMAGAGGGLAAQAATRLVTSASKDKFGDRSHLGKKIDKLPWQVPALIAGGIIGKRAYKAGALKLSSKGKLIQFISDDEEKRIGESLQGERDWRKAKGQVARATQGVKRGTRLTQDLIRAAKGQKNLDSRGRERKREWDKPWVRNAITGTIAVGTLAGFHRVIKSTGPGSQLGRMKEMYHKGDFHEAARNKIPGFKKVHDWVRGFKGNATAEAGAAAENSGVLGKMLDKVQKAAGRTGQEAKTIRNIDGSTTVLPAGTTARIAHDKRTMPTAEKEIAQTADEITRKQAARLREIQGGTIIKNSAKGKVIQFQKFQYDGELYDERRDGDLVKLKKIRRRNRDETPTLDTKRWHESLWTPAKIGGGVVAGALGARLLGPRMNAASAASSSVKRITKTTDLREELKRVVNQHSLDPIVTLNATLDRAIEFGTRTLAGGQIVKWGKHLPSKLPLGTHGESRRGIYQIFDPTKRASVTIQRSRGPMPHEGEAKTKVEKLFNPQANGGKGGTVEINTPQASEKWWKGKNAYLANTNMQPAIRKTPEGAIAAGSLMVGSRAPGATQRTGGLLPHLDHRGVTARTTAGAYQRTSVKSKMEGTHDLVRQYQKRGFKIDARGSYPNEWNVGMIRKPGAKPIEPIEAQKYDTYMRSSRSRALSGAAKGISRHLKELIPGAGTMTGVAALTGTAAVANSDSEHSDLAKKTLVPLAIAGGGLAAHKLYKTGKYIAGHAKEISDHALTAAAHGRLGIGRRLAESSSRGSKWLGGRMLRGYA